MVHTMPKVPLPPPQIQSGQVVFGLANPTARRPDIDDLFIRAVKDEFPVVANRQLLAPEAPLQIPYLVLQSTACRLAVSAVGAELEVRFYGDFTGDYIKCRAYLRAKALAVINGWAAATETVPAFVGIVLSTAFSFKDREESPVRHLIQTHLNLNIADVNLLQDALARVSLRIEDRYFFTVTLSNYAAKVVERPMFAGQVIQVKPWEGDVADIGITALIDVNNRLEAIIKRKDPRVNSDEFERILQIVDAGMNAAPAYVEGGKLEVKLAAGEPKA